MFLVCQPYWTWVNACIWPNEYMCGVICERVWSTHVQHFMWLGLDRWIGGGGGREEGFHRLCLNRIQEFSKSLWLDAPTTITLSKRALSKISKIATRLSFSQCNVWEKCSFLGVHPPYPFSFVLFMRWCWHLKQNKVKWVNSFSTLKKDCQVLGCPLAHDN